MFTPRLNQQEVLNYRYGKMGVSAVPGSGKTHILSALAAGIISGGQMGNDQEVLIVTLVNSAVDNFSARVGGFIKDIGLLPHVGYRVRTLHGLAHDIVRDRPALVGLQREFQIIDERAAEQVRTEAAYAWLRAHPYDLDQYLNPELEESRLEWVRREQLPDLVDSLSLSFIRYAKDEQLTPAQLKERLESLPVPLPLAEIGAAIYSDYQRALTYRGAVDFDDLIRLALQALILDESYLERLRQRWPYILEDEAQDSSLLQEEILRHLSGPTGNWVRVGDPNQAIYETFTTASPEYLIRFLEQADVTRRELPDSGRSSQSIIDLANSLIDWTRLEHPLEAARSALNTPYIQATPPGDPQSNPPDDPAQVRLVLTKMTPQEEVAAVAHSVDAWLKDHPEETVAVLAPRNQRGFDLVNELKRRNVDYVEILRSTSATRAAAGALGDVLGYLSDPQSATKLARAYRAWRRSILDQASGRALVDRVSELLRKCAQIEDYIWPQADRDWLGEIGFTEADSSVPDELSLFRNLVQRWHGTTMLPIDQAVLTLAQDLFTEPTDLAIAHKLAVIMRQASSAHLDWRLPELTEELAVVARNERRFLGFSEDDTGFQPERYKGKVVVATIHKAKGLEWDRVYLMSVNNYDFPSGMPYDHYMPERWYLRGSLNLEAEALAQLKAAISHDPYAWYQAGEETQKARLDYVKERLRLLYVGITRAKKELVITWNTGRQGDLQPALPVLGLQSFWEKHIVRTRREITMELPTDFQFSQGSLQDFVDCPRRFQLRYLQRVSWPAVETEPLIENERFRKMGQLFHRLVHQQILGLPEERLLNIAACSRQGGVELQTWWQNYLSWAASLEKLEHPGKVYPEISLAGRIGGAGLTATYDAIMVDGGTDDPHITIMDWKTSRQRPRRSWLFDRLQTRVYLCLLVNAGAFLAGGKALSPDHVDMVYWFAGFPDDPEHFTYSEERYQEDRVYITGLIDQIKAVEDAKFPTRSGHGMCKFCLYRSLCERGLVPGILGESDGFEQSFIVEDVSGPDDLDLDFDQIVEIEF